MLYKRHVIAAILLLVFFCMPPSIWAVGNIYLGRVHVQPGLSYSGIWDDNLFLESSDEESDYIHSIKPSLQLDYERDRNNYATLSSYVDILRYDEFSDNDYEEYSLEGEVRYTSPMGFFAQLNEDYLNTEDRYSSLNNYRLGEARVKRWLNTAGLTVGYEANGWTAHLKYSNYLLRYDLFRDQWQDRTDHRFELKGTYRVLPKTSVLLMYRLQDQNYPNQEDTSDNNKVIDSDTSQDNVYHQVFTGLAFSPSAKINGEIRVGAGRKDYENDENWNGQDYNDDWKLNAETKVIYNYSPKTKFRLQLYRNELESTEPEAASFTRTQFGLGATQTFFRKFTFDIELAYLMEDYDTGAGFPSRDDDIYDLNLGLDYQIQEWLSTGVKYKYLDRSTSNDVYEDEEYTDNRITLYIQVEL
jgi:hypothetical protein